MFRWLICLLLECLLAGEAAAASPLSSPALFVNLPSRTLELYDGTQLIGRYPVAIGKTFSQTPQGQFQIYYKEINPDWIPEGKDIDVPSGPDNPLGYRWMEFSPGYGIHGTCVPESIGTAASGGCIRMNEADVEEVFDQVPVGTPLTITYERIVVRVETNGEVSVGVYPDIYGLMPVTADMIKGKLAPWGLADFISDPTIQFLLDTNSDQQVVIGRVKKFKINGTRVDKKILVTDGRLYLPIDPVVEQLKTSYIFDENQYWVSCRGKIVPAKRYGSMVYCAKADFLTLFGGEIIENEAAGCYDWTVSTMN